MIGRWCVSVCLDVDKKMYIYGSALWKGVDNFVVVNMHMRAGVSLVG